MRPQWVPELLSTFKGICCIIVSENMWAEGKVYSVICFIPASVVGNEKVLL